MKNIDQQPLKDKAAVTLTSSHKSKQLLPQKIHFRTQGHIKLLPQKIHSKTSMIKKIFTDVHKICQKMKKILEKNFFIIIKVYVQ